MGAPLIQNENFVKIAAPLAVGAIFSQALRPSSIRWLPIGVYCWRH